MKKNFISASSYCRYGVSLDSPLAGERISLGTMSATNGTTRTTYTIGEFSTVTSLSLETQRFFQERGILVPSSVDAASGYR